MAVIGVIVAVCIEVLIFANEICLRVSALYFIEIPFKNLQVYGVCTE
jgi:hypothetical protein